jgi:hypothetical protein
MLERLHEHITSELGQSSRTDTIFILVAVIFNLIALGINSAASGVAIANRDTNTGNLAADVVLAVFIAMTLLVNGKALAGLYFGRQTRGKLLSGLVAMYTDSKVDNIIINP